MGKASFQRESACIHYTIKRISGVFLERKMFFVKGKRMKMDDGYMMTAV